MVYLELEKYLHFAFCQIVLQKSILDLNESQRIKTCSTMSTDFYLRYYVGHKGKFGHEFLEFEFRPDGKLRYANNSNYKNDTMIRWAFSSPAPAVTTY